jgi:hypothetical protein
MPMTAPVPNSPEPARDLGYHPALSPDRWRLLLQRIGRVLRFDSSVYIEIANDPRAGRGAAAVVAAVAVAAGIGGGLLTRWHGGTLGSTAGTAVLHWLIWATATYIVATLVFGRHGGLRALYRSMGFAQAPTIVAIFIFIPVIGPWIVLAGRLMTLVASNFAVQAALGLDQRRAMVANGSCFLLAWALSALLKSLVGDLGWWELLLSP